MPAPRKPDQASPKLTSPTGVTNGQTPDVDPRSQFGAYLTTAQGLRLPDTDHSLKAEQN
jgi:catalase